MIWTRNLLIWSQTRYRCATESATAAHKQINVTPSRWRTDPFSGTRLGGGSVMFFITEVNSNWMIALLSTCNAFVYTYALPQLPRGHGHLRAHTARVGARVMTLFMGNYLFGVRMRKAIGFRGAVAPTCDWEEQALIQVTEKLFCFFFFFLRTLSLNLFSPVNGIPTLDSKYILNLISMKSTVKFRLKLLKLPSRD